MISGNAKYTIDGTYHERVFYDAGGNVIDVSRTNGSNGLNMFSEGYKLTGVRQYRQGGRQGSIRSIQYDKKGNISRSEWHQRQYEYNIIDKLSKVSDLNGNPLVWYSYTSDGNKLKVIDPNGNGFLYMGSLQYVIENHVPRLESTPFAGGRLTATETPSGVIFTPEFHIKDYLGNVRATINTANGSGIAYNNYTPYGVRWSDDGAAESGRYLFNGKEKQITGDLNWLDYGARMYDPELCRWLNPDPATQFANPYIFSGNNPVMYVDSDGRFIVGTAFALAFTLAFDFATLLLATVIKGFVYGDWGDYFFDKVGQDMWNNMKIFGGLFAGSWDQVLSRFTWEALQSSIGVAMNIGLNYGANIEYVGYYGGATVVATDAFDGGVTLSSYITGRSNMRADPNDDLFQHEYGHYIQSQREGIAYLFNVAIPSTKTVDKGHAAHNANPVEQEANRLAIEYFDSRIDKFAWRQVLDPTIIDKGWNHNDNRIIGWPFRKNNGYDYRFNVNVDMPNLQKISGSQNSKKQSTLPNVGPSGMLYLLRMH